MSNSHRGYAWIAVLGLSATQLACSSESATPVADAPVSDAPVPDARPPDAAPGPDASPCMPTSSAPPLDPAVAGIPASGLVLWLRSDVGVSTLASGEVCAWKNQVGEEVFVPGGRFLTTNASAPPVLVLDWEPGTPALRSAPLHCMSLKTVLGIAPTSGRTFFSVTEVVDVAGRRQPLMQGLPTSDRLFVGLDQNTFNSAGQRYGVYVSGAAFDSSVPTAAGRRAVESAVVDGLVIGNQNASIIHYYNNGTLGTLTYRGNVTTVLDMTTMNTTYVACSESGTTLQPEAILYSRPLGDSERKQVEQYLATRYGVTLP